MKDHAIGAVLLAALTAAAPPGIAQSLVVLHAFDTQLPNSPNGTLVRGGDGNYYGTTYYGGAGGRGAVFRISSDGMLANLHSFSGADGSNPADGLAIGADGTFYGTTRYGGPSDHGTVFKISPWGTLTTLHTFSGLDGLLTSGSLVRGTDGAFYGTTAGGGAIGGGSIFRITPTGTFNTLCSFGSDGTMPYDAGGLAQDAAGNLYGTTYWGGANVKGTVFRVTPAGVLTTLHSFSGTDGAYPYAGLRWGKDGNLYGATYAAGGASSGGTIFRITPAGAFTTLHVLGSGDGRGPYAALTMGIDGNFYGTTTGGGSELGTVFRVTPDGAFTVLYSFGGSDGSDPLAGLAQDADGRFFGTTFTGGTADLGTFFVITPAGALTTLYSFRTSVDGRGPAAGLTLSTDGNFYGTTTAGGPSGKGTAFRIAASGAFATLHSFAGTDGQTPYADLVEGSDGNFYGTTDRGGTNGMGTVFSMTPGGSVTTLHSFAGADGRQPFLAGLVQGTGGDFLGTTTVGGANGYGNVFTITPAGTISNLHSFTNADGRSPSASLAKGTDGNFYGTSYWGGANDLGTVFRITPAGTLTPLLSFGGPDGAKPEGRLVQAADGNFYGTTTEGGSQGQGTVFRMTPAGALTTLHSLQGSDGTSPFAGLLEASDGNLYGTAGRGGAGNAGTIFRMTPSGTFTTLYAFTGIDGSGLGGLTEGVDGNLYGVAGAGGGLGGGVVFRLTLGPGPAPTVTGVAPSSGPSGGGAIVTVSGTEFQPGATVTFGETAAAAVTYVSAKVLYALAPAHAAGNVSVRVTNPDLQAATLASAFTYLPGPAPTITSVSPNNGTTLGGTTVTILGTNFVGGTTISIGGVAATGVAFVDPTTLTATTGAHATGTVDVVVTNPDPLATTLKGGFFYAPPPAPTSFSTLPPCRIVDTRSLSTGGPALAPSSTRTFTLAGSCGVPANAVAVAANLTVVSRGPGYLAAFPGNAVYPGTSNLSFSAGQTRAADAILYLATDGTGTVKVLNGSGGANDFILDVSGFFQ